MKYVIFLGDGMADYKVPQLGDKTPLEAANTPSMDRLAGRGLFGLARTVPHGMPPGSDVANLSVFGCDPGEYYTGRSPLEAANLGIPVGRGDVVFRCNFVTLGGDNLEQATMDDYCADEISNEEARLLIDMLNENFATDSMRFYAGKSYRNCLVIKNTEPGADLTPPHDISGRPVRDYLPRGRNGERIRELMSKIFELPQHPVNAARVKAGKNPANAAWIWGEGVPASLPNFKDRYGIEGGVISAVDLIHGIGKRCGLKSIEVPGATGNYHTDFAGKGRAAIEALSDGYDFLYIHVEAPDECGHRGEINEKVYSIEKVDSDVVEPVMRYLEDSGEDYAVMVLPDHPTPLSLLTHTSDPVPFVIYRRGDAAGADTHFTERCAAETGVVVEEGHTLMDMLIKGGISSNNIQEKLV